MVRTEQHTQSSNKQQVLKKTVSIKEKCVCFYLRKIKGKCGKASNRDGIKRKRLIYG